MNITVQIPRSIARGLRVPEAEAEHRVREELAAALYARGLQSFGKASELAGVSRFAFADVVAQRGVFVQFFLAVMPGDRLSPETLRVQPDVVPDDQLRDMHVREPAGDTRGFRGAA